MTYTVINTRSHEIAYSGPHSSVAGRTCMRLGAHPAGWVKVSGNVADAKAAAAKLAGAYQQYR